MFSQIANIRIPGFGWDKKPAAKRVIDLPPVTTYEVETDSSKASRTCKHLIKANHVNHAILFNNLKFHNHMPHILGSAYVLGASADHLQKIYDQDSKPLEPWRDSPSEITINDWRDYLGKREYERAFVDFFEDQLVALGYDWRQLLDRFLYDEEEPLIYGMANGLGHCVIHLGYAYELCSPALATEALAMTAVCHQPEVNRYFTDPKYTRKAPYKTTSIVEIFQKIYEDKRFDGMFDTKGPWNLAELLEDAEEALLDHWNALDLSDPMARFKDAQEAATAAFIASELDPDKKNYDFFLCHTLTTSHSLRIILPLVRPEYQLSLLRQWLFLTLVEYITQLRPEIKLAIIKDYPLNGKTWDTVLEYTFKGTHSLDEHYVKSIRAIMVAAETWGDKDEYWLKSAVQFAEGFSGWFGSSTVPRHTVRL